MSEEMTHVNRLVKVWLKTDSGKREMLRRDWPELADCLDAVTWRPEGEAMAFDVEAGLKKILGDAYQPPAPRAVVKNGEPRCEAMHNPGVWPYVRRCVLPLDHERRNDHIDSDGKEWRNEPCDGCHNLRRMERSLPQNDEDAAYRFQRAARHHRKECPNR